MLNESYGFPDVVADDVPAGAKVCGICVELAVPDPGESAVDVLGTICPFC